MEYLRTKPLFAFSHHFAPFHNDAPFGVRDALSIVFLVIILIATWVWLKDLMKTN